MVNIVEDWIAFEEYASQRSGFFQILNNDMITELRVLAGRLAFKREFESRESPLYNRILDFCRRNCFIRVSQTSETSSSSDKRLWRECGREWLNLL